MSYHAWKSCNKKSNETIKIGETAYLLIPKEFGGGSVEDVYDGYTEGFFAEQKKEGGVYAIVAEWNKPYLTEKNLGFPPQLSDCEGLTQHQIDSLRDSKGYSESEIEFENNKAKEDNYQFAIDEYNYLVKLISDYKTLSEEEMESLYGFGYEEYIGQNIAFSDEQNFNLKFPIKISDCKDDVYELCNPSRNVKVAILMRQNVNGQHKIYCDCCHYVENEYVTHIRNFCPNCGLELHDMDD